MCKDVQDYIHDSNKYELYTVISPVSGLQPEIFLILHDERVKDKATGCRDLPIKLYYSSDWPIHTTFKLIRFISLSEEETERLKPEYPHRTHVSTREHTNTQEEPILPVDLNPAVKHQFEQPPPCCFDVKRIPT